MSDYENQNDQTGGAAQPPRDGRKSTHRRKRRRRMGPLGALLYVVFVIGVSAILAGVGWVAANDVLALNKAPHSAVITVTENEDFGSVVKQLKENGIIEFTSVFHLYAAFSDAKTKLAPGTYELSTDMDYRAIVSNMGTRSTSRIISAVTIPEGYTVAQIFQLLDEKGISTVEKLENMAATHDYNFSFLKAIPLGKANRLEGYLFPDTYEFYLGEDPKTVINKMLVNFDRRFTEAMRQEVAANEGSIHDIIIIASLIEKETDGADQTKIAAVIYNRLNHPDKGTNGFLQIDATVQYALPQRKEKLSASDLEINSPYNTYMYTGLPAGPIANPGMAAINAALHPAETNSYYYALGDDGVHHFFKTLKEQQNFTATQELYKNG